MRRLFSLLFALLFGLGKIQIHKYKKYMRKLNKVCEYLHATDLYDCPKCKKELRNFKAELQAKIDAVPIELKQKFLDYLKAGKNVGEAMFETDPLTKFENIVWYNIVGNQIENHSYQTFNFQAK
jgi:hypothetical protein